MSILWGYAAPGVGGAPISQRVAILIIFSVLLGMAALIALAVIANRRVRAWYGGRLFRRRAHSTEDWWKWYNFYLRTPEWERRRQGILTRSQGRCEKCGRFVPVQAHHVTYERVGFELPEDLAALCFECHKSQHPWKRF